ncbi:NAD-dependent epimerase/dehydratase family protein [Devosia aurantiaca]|uniref:NAD-dependent epimerase/dehydratase family protein n=1 Tax=Devosia aurantiaca TaxID=2714858 RepID=A0A6M1SIN0_9HYPH|nr:NAD-dependent epimerase/dehydratase family protein [Devosia aurantiaca]NGP17048.1 NAD-dependent epimerase/dehydratase family protein [Devosia aurantiaca]
MTVAVLGGTGFIGSAIVESLVLRGLSPVVIARGEHPIVLPDGAVFEAADRMDRERLSSICDKHGITTVIDIFALGMLNTAPVLAALEDAGRRYVLLSSVDVYSNYGGLLRREEPAVQHHPAVETDPLRSFRYPYRGNARRPKGVDDALFDDYDKIIIEETALADQRFSTTVIRAPMIFGPGDKQHRFAWAIEAIRAGGTIRLDERAAHWLNSYGYVTDVAEAIVVAALDPRAADRTYNVGQSFVRTPVEWLHRFAEIMGISIDIETVPASERGLLWERAEASDLRYPLTLDTSRIRAELGFSEPTSEDAALHKTIAAGG